MIIKVTMKTPDSLNNAIEQACEDEIGGHYDDELKDEEFNRMVEQTKKLAKKWFRYNELVTLVIDTEKRTCIVAEV